MPGIDLSTLSGTELRRLLKVAQSRGDEGLAGQLQAELSARGAGGQRIGGPAPRPDPAPEEAPSHMVWREEPLGLTADRGPPHAPGRGFPLVGLGVAAAGLVAAVVSWNLIGSETPLPGPAEPPAPRAMVARSEPLQPAPDPAPVAAVTPPALRRPATPPPPPPTPARIAKVEPAIKGPLRTTDPCSSPPTPADRVVCSDLAIAELHREMREAYVRALNARADPYVVGQAQDAWRRARDPISDPQRLAQLYDRRIRELNAATAAARAEQPPY